jgi:YD repeat-containing protein
MNEQKRRENEGKYEDWQELADGGRRYFYVVPGRFGWTARYVKEVDATERTVRFHQEIYDGQGRLVEIHEKYPVDKGHQPLPGGE